MYQFCANVKIKMFALISLLTLSILCCDHTIQAPTRTVLRYSTQAAIKLV